MGFTKKYWITPRVFLTIMKFATTTTTFYIAEILKNHIGFAISIF